jgi:MFS family permease
MTPASLASQYNLFGVSMELMFGALFAVFGIGMLWWGVLALRDGEKQPGIPCTVLGLLLIAGSLSLFGVF